MTLDRNERIREIFFEALERPSNEQRGFVDEASAGDIALRDEVLSLLGAHGEAEGFLDPVAPGAAGSDARIGSSLGPYKLLSILGLGGMGSVYLAERADEEYHKQVAIKVLKRGLDTEDILRRFRMEREMLAQLEHPGIARLIDSGTTEDGLPYLVMDYIEGVPIDRYCDENDLGIGARLELFRDVCEAVGYAHRNLIVHRDIKPGNILVDGGGRVRLLDFGIAKVLDPSAIPGSVAVTRPEWRVFTPEYASPEQIRAGRVTTASDIYSLGVLLYQLLTRQRPYRFETRSPSEVERLVCDTDPPRPSQAVSGAQTPGTGGAAAPAAGETGTARSEALRRRLSGDIDDIVMKALRKEPERRYGTVDEFSEDIRRHLEGLPVAARGDTWTYRAVKFVHRHRGAVAAASAFAVLLVGFAITMSVQAARLAVERDRAAREAATANRTVELLERTFLTMDPWEGRGDSVTVREMIDSVTVRVRAMDDEPLIQARLMNLLGHLHANRADYATADSLITQALDVRRRLLPPDHIDIGHSLYSTGWLAHNMGHYEVAATRVRAALEILEQVPGSEDVGLAYMTLGRSLNVRGEIDSASVYFERALAIFRALPEQSDRRLGSTLTVLSGHATIRGDYERARELASESLERLQRALGPDHLEVADLYEQLSVIMNEGFHDYVAQREYCVRALEIREARLGPTTPQVGLSVYSLGFANYMTGDLRDAEAQMARAERILVDALGDTNAFRALCIAGLAMVDAAEGRLKKAHAGFERARRIALTTVGPQHRFTGLLHVGKGQTAAAMGDPGAAGRDLRAGVEILALTQDYLHRNHQRALLRLAGLYAREGRTAEADSIHALAAEGVEKLRNDPEHCYYVAAYEASRGDTRRAMIWLKRSIDGGWQLQGVEYDPSFDAMRTLPEFTRLLARRGMQRAGRSALTSARAGP